MNYKNSYESPIGTITLESDGEYLTGLWFNNTKDDIKHNGVMVEKELPVFDETKKWLDIYFNGEEVKFTPKYKINNLTPFRKMVIDLMLKIPYGKVVTYNDIAKEISYIKKIKKMSAQAVGSAVGWNPICLIIPCHRVVAQNGKVAMVEVFRIKNIC